jgi:biotin transport system substrate-specific component
MAGLLLQARRLAALPVVTSPAGRRTLAVGVFALLTALGAYAAVPIAPVPVTLQTLFVLLAGLLLGPRLGSASQVAYVSAGLVGLPVFAAGAFGPAVLLGPTGGYLIAFPVGAWLAGALAAPPSAKGLAATLRTTGALVVASLAIFAGGAAQLAVLTGDVGLAIRVGVLPFLAGGVFKIAAALLVAARLRNRTLGLL